MAIRAVTKRRRFSNFPQAAYAIKWRKRTWSAAGVSMHSRSADGQMDFDAPLASRRAMPANPIINTEQTHGHIIAFHTQGAHIFPLVSQQKMPRRRSYGKTNAAAQVNDPPRLLMRSQGKKEEISDNDPLSAPQKKKQPRHAWKMLCVKLRFSAQRLRRVR